jgi:hypothetical protein
MASQTAFNSLTLSSGLKFGERCVRRRIKLSPRRARWSPPDAAKSGSALLTRIFTDHSRTAVIYLSFFDASGPANMLDNTSRLREPWLWVAGTADRSQPGPGDALSRAPANPLNRYVTVSADHLGTPTAAREAVLDWLREFH